VPSPFFIFLFAVTALYLTQTLIIYLGTNRLNYSRTTKLPSISVLIALRNEEESLEACVYSLQELDYPAEKLEVVLINDRSTDRTGQLIEAFKMQFLNIKTLQIKNAIPGLSGKANAIAQGFDLAENELILITDGDCVVPPSWAKTHASYYETGVGMVGGFTLLSSKGENTPIFERIQSLDWAYLLSIGTGAIGFGRPLSVLGNNLSFRREAYESVGGYRNMGFTIIEDFALMKTLLLKSDWRVRYPIDPKMLVTSLPMPTFAKFYEQRKRWSAGGKEVGAYGKFLMTTSWLTHLLVVTGLLLGSSHAFACLLLVLSADYFLLRSTTKKVARKDLMRVFPAWEAFYFFYTTVFSPVLLFPTTVSWKNINYSWKFNFKLKQISETE